MRDEVDFLPVNKHQSFLQIDTINLGVWLGMPNAQNNKFYISLQYLKKEISDKVFFFLHANKHGSFPQVDTMICREYS